MALPQFMLAAARRGVATGKKLNTRKGSRKSSAPRLMAASRQLNDGDNDNDNDGGMGVCDDGEHDAVVVAVVSVVVVIVVVSFDGVSSAGCTKCWPA